MHCARLYDAETCKQSGRNCSKHQQCNRKNVGKICLKKKETIETIPWLTIKHKNYLPYKENTFMLSEYGIG